MVCVSVAVSPLQFVIKGVIYSFSIYKYNFFYSFIIISSFFFIFFASFLLYDFFLPLLCIEKITESKDCIYIDVYIFRLAFVCQILWYGCYFIFIFSFSHLDSHPSARHQCFFDKHTKSPLIDFSLYTDIFLTAKKDFGVFTYLKR